ncbi:MAG TPA: DUF1566 domain-containing protein [Vicinamibacterales bacterium]|nr:DUF1566 domain-containing protein [Vicinamibacterales bacterium]
MAAGPYYATPSFDQKLQCDTTASCPRFVVLSNWSNEAVLDRETGLVWQQNPSSQSMTWGIAMQGFLSESCLLAHDGGRRGWRMPTIEELQTLGDGTGGLGLLPAGHPFGANAVAQFWSATSSQLVSGDALVWTFGFPSIGTTFGADAKTNSHSVWCVRSPAPGLIGR